MGGGAEHAANDKQQSNYFKPQREGSVSNFIMRISLLE